MGMANACLASMFWRKTPPAPVKLTVSAPPVASKGKKILIADDDKVIRQTLSMKLKAAGYSVIEAEDGAGTVQNARYEAPDLIILDLSFPPDVANGGGVPWDGFMIMDWLRGYGECKHIPIIAISADELSRWEARATAKGARAAFQKPIQTPNLISSIDELLLVFGVHS